MNIPEPQRALTFDSSAPIQITIAPNAGACFGVVRAIKLGRQALKDVSESAQVYSLGPLIHNPTVVDELSEKGLEIVESAAEVSGGTVVLRSHGVQKQIETELRERGVSVIDATCPLVKKPQRIAQGLGKKGYFLILVGDRKHPEVKGVVSYFGSDNYLVTYSPDDITAISTPITKVGIVAQTTIEDSVFQKIVAKAKEHFSEVVVYNTICDATSIRQSEAVELAKQADVMVVVGGKNSSNTCKLVKICKDFVPETYHIEELNEILPEWFRGKIKIGVTGGASTPHEFVDSVGTHIAQLIQSHIAS